MSDTMTLGRDPRKMPLAHCDTGDDYLGSRFHHGAPFRRAVEEGLIDPKRTIQIGIRGSLNVADMWQFSYDGGMRVVSIEKFYDKGWRWPAEEALGFRVDRPPPAFPITAPVGIRPPGSLSRPGHLGVPDH